ncbi:hypothetical protein Q5752_003701 [Cryptotrichosporon argae]
MSEVETDTYGLEEEDLPPYDQTETGESSSVDPPWSLQVYKYMPTRCQSCVKYGNKLDRLEPGSAVKRVMEGRAREPGEPLTLGSIFSGVEATTGNFAYEHHWHDIFAANPTGTLQVPEELGGPDGTLFGGKTVRDFLNERKNEPHRFIVFMSGGTPVVLSAEDPSEAPAKTVVETLEEYGVNVPKTRWPVHPYSRRLTKYWDSMGLNEQTVWLQYHGKQRLI